MKERGFTNVVRMGGQRIIGLDIGATKIAAGIVTAGKVSHRHSTPTRTKEGPDAIMEAITSVLEPLIKETPSKLVGIGMAGATNSDKGVFVHGPNFPESFSDVPIAKILGKRYGADVRIDNDVHCFALGEALYGAGAHNSRVFGMTIGTGIGGGIVENGKTVRGAHNTAGEVGHITVNMDGDAVCGCGKKGHLEAYASGTGISRHYEKATGELVLASDIGDRARAGDTDALAAYTGAKHALAAGIADICHLFDPDIIIIGGGLANDHLLWNGLREEVNDRLVFTALRQVRISQSRLLSDANVLGAAALHRKK